jgi:hypothetical protein
MGGDRAVLRMVSRSSCMDVHDDGVPGFDRGSVEYVWLE